MRLPQIVAAVLLSLFLNIGAETIAQTNRSCILAGTYRIDVRDSDQLYSTVENAVSGVPFGDQQRFFFDLSVRLTPPDMLALDCKGNRVSIASSRAPKATFAADGKTRQERTSSGDLIRARVELAKDTLTFTSSGRKEDRIDVKFQSLENGRRLLVIRSIYADQLRNPVVIRTVYDKIAESVQWDIYANRNIAARTRRTPAVPLPEADSSRPVQGSSKIADTLRSALDEWIAATNRRDIDGQMEFYMPQLEAFYLARNSTRALVWREKNQTFGSADFVDIRAEEPEIVFQDGGATAVMRFRKTYKVEAGNKIRNGIVIQELRWRRTNDDWRIFSERDVRVIR